MFGCDGAVTCCGSIQHRCSGGPVTARTATTLAWNSRSPLRLVVRVGRRRLRGRRKRVVAAAADTANRRDAVVETHRRERRVLPGPQHDATAAEFRIVADLPASALDDDGRGAVVESCAVQIVDRLVDDERPPVEAILRIQGGLAGRGARDQRGGENSENVGFIGFLRWTVT
jgi:hypothetical protein